MFVVRLVDSFYEVFLAEEYVPHVPEEWDGGLHVFDPPPFEVTIEPMSVQDDGRQSHRYQAQPLPQTPRHFLKQYK